MSFLKSESSRSDVPLEFRRFSRKAITDEGDFVDKSLVRLLSSLASLDDLEHFRFGHRLDLLNREMPFSSFFLPLLLDHITENLGSIDFISVHQVGWDGAVSLFLLFNAGVLLLMSFDHFPHLDLLLISLFGENFGLDSPQVLGVLGDLVLGPGFLLALLLFVIKASAITFAVQLDVVPLRLHRT